MDKIIPTEEERRNGWTDKTLTAYIASREKDQFNMIDPNSPQRRTKPQVQNFKYNPHRWRD